MKKMLYAIKSISCGNKSFLVYYTLHFLFLFLYNAMLILFPVVCFYLKTGYSKIVLYFVAILCINIINKIFSTIFELKLEDQIISLDVVVMDKLHRIPFEVYENPIELNEINRIIFSVKNQRAIQNMFKNFSSFIQNIFQMIVVLIIVTSIHYVFGIICCLGFVLNFVIMKMNRKDENKFYEFIIEDNRRMGFYTRLITETENIKELFIYNGFILVKDKVLQYINDSTKSFRKLMKNIGKYDAFVALMHRIIIMLIYIICVYITLTTHDNISNIFIVFTSLTVFTSISSSTLKYGFETFQMLDFVLPYIHLLDKKIKESNNHQVFNSSEAIIEFKQICFKYPNTNKWILDKVSFKINEGELVTIVGENGAGKSTILKLILKLLVPTSGEILIQGRNIKDINENEFYEKVNVIFQDYVIFPDNIRENIIMDKDINEAIYKRITKLLQIDQLDDDASIGMQYTANSTQFSGGQNQKIAIARALVKLSDCLIMDEPTAALDPLAEKDIIDKVLFITENKTRLIISHRLSTCVQSNRILVVENGKVVEEGNHENLMKKNGIYAKMFNTQKELYYGR